MGSRDTPERPRPVVCDMSHATDTPAERLAEYRHLFSHFLLGRSRSGAGIRFRFQAGPGVEDRLRDLARRESNCCAFAEFTVHAGDDEVWWEATAADDVTRQILDEFYRLPDTVADGDAAVRQAFESQGLRVI